MHLCVNLVTVWLVAQGVYVAYQFHRKLQKQNYIYIYKWLINEIPVVIPQREYCVMSNGILDWIPFFRKDPKEVVQKWRREIRKEKNHINRDIRNLMMEQKKVERSIKEAAQRNDLVSAKVRCGSVS